MEFNWGGAGIGAIVGATAVCGWGAVVLGDDKHTWIFVWLFLVGCALIGGLS